MTIFSFTFISFLKEHFVDGSESSSAYLSEIKEVLGFELVLRGVDLQLARRIGRSVQLELVLGGNFSACSRGLKNRTTLMTVLIHQ